MRHEKTVSESKIGILWEEDETPSELDRARPCSEKKIEIKYSVI